MAIRAPWKGWLRVAMPIVSFLILSFTLIITILSVLNAATLGLSYTDGPIHVLNHTSQLRIQLVFFWCTIPVILLITTVCETLCLWTDHLRPLWICISSATACGLWITQFVLWSLCLPNNGPKFCPTVYHGAGLGKYSPWTTSSPTTALYLVPFLLICYLIQLALAAHVLHRQRRSSFRETDLRGSWALKQELAASHSSLASSSETRLMLEPGEEESHDSLSQSSILDLPSGAGTMLRTVPRAHARVSRARSYSAMSAAEWSGWSGRSPGAVSEQWSAFSGTWERACDRSPTASARSLGSVEEADLGVVSPIRIDISQYNG